eukprot:TRINITY_DN620_c0_g1_i1.p1 TRINITY_DN620_c0_g1~~TRINITY_DN620_c0_g1_i1.p1  ORF type:complete len:481 (+),score=113.17 TRINITY_DN620_c0_g1_i1:138-1580(+)
MSAQEAGYGATDCGTTADALENAANVTECSMVLPEGEGGSEAGAPVRACLPNRLRMALCALCVSAICCGGASMAAASALRSQGSPAQQVANGSGSEGLPPAVELMREVPRTLTEYVLDPYALCHDLGHAQQPVYIGMLQSGLVSVTMTVFAMLPPPLGGGDPMHPGMVGFVFASWNVCSALVFIAKSLFINPLPSGPILSAFERYEFRWWLAAQNPKFQGMVTIFIHKAVCCLYTIVIADRDMGEMLGWRRYLSQAILGVAGAGFALVVLPLFVTHLLPQLVLLPVGVIVNLINLGFYKMLLSILCSVALTVAMLLGPAGSLMGIAATWHKPKYGDNQDAASKLVYNKLASVTAVLLVVFIQDFTVNSMMVYHNVSGPGAAQISAFSARQTCAWAQCAANQVKGSSGFQKVNEWVELSPVLDAAAGLIPLDCYAPDGSITHHANMLVFLIAMAIVLAITAVGVGYAKDNNLTPMAPNYYW